MMRRLLLALFFAQAHGALAHAFLTHATPPVGSTVRKAPAQVTLRFTQRLELAFSKVQVEGAGGKRVDTGDPTLAEDGTAIAVAVPPLTPGRYTVKWRVLSVDTHVTEGDFTFDVRP